MLTLIHGDDIASSRNYLQSLKQNNTIHETIDGDKTELTEVMQLFDGGNLFEEKKVLFLEQFINKKKQTKEYDAILTYIVEKAKENDVYLWENKELDRPLLTPFAKHTVKVFSYPQTLFQFLDALKPTNTLQLVQLFHTTLQKTEAEIIFYMLTRHIRILLFLYESTDAQIDEVKRMQSWQKTKLTKQAKLFRKDALVKLHTKLFAIDKGIKTGTLQIPLSVAIDFFLMEV